MFVPLIILFLVSGILCDPSDCVRKERITCGESPLERGFPGTTEEFQTTCRDMITFGSCMLHVHELCGHDEETLSAIRKMLGFVNSVCDEDSFTYKVLSSNIECIMPVVKNLENICNQWKMSPENFDLAAKHEMEISDNYTREDMQECLIPFWQVSCRSIVMGLRCGSEVKEVMHDIFSKVEVSYEKCSSEVLEELQPLYETFEFIIEAELRVQNLFKKRK